MSNPLTRAFPVTNPQDNLTASQEVEVEGHLIDSMILTRIMDLIMDLRGDFEVTEFRIGKRKTEQSYARLIVKGKSQEHLDLMMKELLRLGAVPTKLIEAKTESSPKDMVLPDGFYSTTNHPTSVFVNGKWFNVENQMMDKQIVINRDAGRAYCKAIRDIKEGDLIVIGEEGIRIRPPERPRSGIGIFEFMSSRVSSEKPSVSLVKNVAEHLYQTKNEGGRIVFVAGPAVVHTGAASSLAGIIRMVYVNALLSGNALAVHDVEYAIFGTSLGMDVETGLTTGSSKNHIAAINEVFKSGSLKAMVEQGRLRSGIFYECIKNNVPYALCGSIRDDGPIPDVIMDTVRAQRQYRELVKDSNTVIMLASMLHSIAVGNLLPSTVRVVCVDINPAVTTKLTDRGTAQAIGIVSDVGTFLPLLASELSKLELQ
ncbi:TIGR00300 family protein [Candidatus Bathyarchaeota archaeon]|nr:TIGR00300 family protein [Candidatus Bathyarchaeota archaeon]